MPKSNSDADENDSLTSDEEAVGPTIGRVELQGVQSAPAALAGEESVIQEVEGGGSSLQPPRPIAKFRSSVISMNRAQSALLDIAPGTEPGADPRKSTTAELFGHIKANCQIEICEYGPSKARFTNYDNKSFIDWLKLNDASTKREIWNKVRWINIAGVSWDIISALALHYGLHPLAIEDVLHGRKNARSKADYYTKHLFVHVLTHKLARQEGESEDSDDMAQTEEPLSIRTSRTSSTVVDRQGFYESGDDGMGYNKKGRGGWLSRRKRSDHTGSNGPGGKKKSGIYGDIEQRAGTGDSAREKPRPRNSILTAHRAKIANEKAIDELKKGFGRVYVDVSSAWMFLLRDGTLISINQNTSKPFGASVADRLRVRDTVLRSSGDASLLLEGLLDLVVDDAVEVDKYHDAILKAERTILLKPNMKTVRGPLIVHIISGDLTLHKRTLGPLSQLVYGLRRYDLDRCKALAGSAGREGEVVGFLSHQAKVYLADVHDHVECVDLKFNIGNVAHQSSVRSRYIMSSLDMFTSIAENLINYTFNIVSYETNQVMRGLTIATVIFFPLTFLTGYFGMNFHIMPSVQEHSETMFWEIAIPVMTVVVAAFMFPDIQKLVHFIKKRMATRKYDVSFFSF
ncbi:CorA-like Mg2+ transporter protein, partial [Rhizoctonia solani]